MNFPALLLHHPLRVQLVAFLDAIDFAAVAHSSKASVPLLRDEALILSLERAMSD